ncbi:serine/threonine protein kinase [Paenibacillus xylaniclasticus]|uniref:serine/threonine protein kinase n=1 Tax=Paenibacillus xylaniclasticus TaxID=588083 RepID=UPI000FD95C26|nr:MULTISPECIES: serine/threonine-protein kinase [Paenibacillus]GFN32130.1 hypothetical protein PCURB6_23900 [Paenibacillus curdlanolyticus]
MIEVPTENCLSKGFLLRSRYKIYYPIACGELSIVYIGRDRLKKETVVIKEYFPRALAHRDLDKSTVLCSRPRLKPSFAEWRSGLVQEAHILRGLNHPQVVRHRDDFEENGTFYLVTDYCRGIPLSQYVQKLQQQGSDPLTMLWQQTLPALLDALQYVHDQEIVHLDLKPSNVLIGRDGMPHLIDFGSALSFRKLPLSRRIQATPGFSALELHSKSAELGPRSDYYSLSAILYYIVCGIVPPDVADRVIEDPLRPIQSLQPQLSSRLAKTIMSGLSLSAGDRPASLDPYRRALKSGFRHIEFR